MCRSNNWGILAALINESPTVLLVGLIFQEKAAWAVEDDISLDGCDSLKLRAKRIKTPSIEWASGVRVVWVILEEEIEMLFRGRRQHECLHVILKSLRVGDV